MLTTDGNHARDQRAPLAADRVQRRRPSLGSTLGSEASVYFSGVARAAEIEPAVLQPVIVKSGNARGQEANKEEKFE